MTAAVVAPRRQPPDPRLLQRCLLLAVLLHIWLVLIFGNATGTAAPGQGVWGSLTVRLLGRSGAEREAPPSPADRSGPVDPTPRTEPAATATPAPPAGEPGTATLKLPEGFRPVERQEVSRPSA
ncbi:hypothetical protein, partial [Roseateles sp.]|uniref:hypothetical protein n=1 Tax=Roseateles sp. TaxID=1971397 RepID=UPI002DFA05B4|nr:hypothetical protein [Roseateles sp.]